MVFPAQDPSEVLESGEETFFPALCVGHESASAVSFWMENQTMNDINKDVSPIDGNSVPLYDRGYALGLTSDDGSNNADG
ncbi:zinc finger CCHC domain-containing protein, partial [Trifolium medium]|nr:zinc finger CCHC domain-containing protein [Trifolium medium]